MRNSQVTKDGSPRITIVFFSEDDPVIENGLGVIQELSEHGEVANFIVQTVGPSSSIVSMLENGKRRNVQLFEELARYENFSRFDLVAICSSRLSDESQVQLVNSVSDSKLELDVLAAGTKAEIKDNRIYFPQYQELGAPEKFLTENASARLVVLPTDKASDLATAAPLYFQDPKTNDETKYHWHVATEVLSICGLWKSQVGSALEEILQPPTGASSQPFQLVRSFARTAQTSLEEIGSDKDSFFSENLTIPPSKIPAPNPFFVARHAAEIIHHKNFRLQPPESMETGKSVGEVDLIKQVMKRIWKDFLLLPSTILYGIQSQLDSATAETAQQIIGGDSWVQVALEDAKATNEDLSDEKIQQAIDLLESQSEKLTNVSMYGSEWKQVLEYSLGIVDGAEQVAELRQSAGNDRWVTVEVGALAPDFSDDLSAMAENLGICDIGSSTEGIKPASKESENLLALVSKKFQDQAEEANRRLQNTMESLRALSEPESEDNEVASKTVRLLFISTFFLFLFVIAAFSPLQNLFETEWGMGEKVIALLIPTGLLLFPISLLFSPVDSKQRQNFVLFSALLIFALVIVGSMFATELSRSLPQVVMPIVITAVVASAVLRIRVIQTGEEEDDKWHRLASKACIVMLPIFVLIASVFTLNTKSYEPNARSINSVDFDDLDDNEKRSLERLVEDQRTIATAADHEDGQIFSDTGRPAFDYLKEGDQINRSGKSSLYGDRGADSEIKESPYDQWKDLKSDLEGDYFDDNRTWLLVSLPLLAVLFITSGVILSVARQREENIFDDWRKRFIWLVQEAKVHAKERRLCENYRVQWLGTALVLARLVHYPHGKSSSKDQSLASNPRPIPATQKLRTISLRPTASGAEIFRETATDKISEPGWLTNQYYKMSSAFLRKETGYTDQIQASAVLPELCPYPVSLSEALGGEASGRRWPFCYEVYEGTFDDDLRLAVREKLTEALLETYLEHPNSYEADGSSSEGSLGKLFGDLIPSDEQRWAPAIFGSEVAANFQGKSRNMTSNIWWPSDMIQASVEQEETWRNIAIATTSTTEESIFSQVIRVDISDVIKLSDLDGQKTGGAPVGSQQISPNSPNENGWDADPDDGKPRIG